MWLFLWEIWRLITISIVSSNFLLVPIFPCMFLAAMSTLFLFFCGLIVAIVGEFTSTSATMNLFHELVYFYSCCGCLLKVWVSYSKFICGPQERFHINVRRTKILAWNTGCFSGVSHLCTICTIPILNYVNEFKIKYLFDKRQ